MFHKTRIAPTPSGYLHLGNILSFAVTAALAKREGAGILLRIDDMDRERLQQNYVQDISIRSGIWIFRGQRAREIYAMLGRMLGLPGTINSWEDIALAHAWGTYMQASRNLSIF